MKENKSDMLIGRNPVTEALKSGREIERLVVQKGAGGSIGKILSLAKDRGVLVHYQDKELLDNLFQDVPGDYEINPDVIHDIMSTGVSAPRFRRYSQAKIMAENAVDTALKSGKAIEEYLVSSQHDINIMLSS